MSNYFFSIITINFNNDNGLIKTLESIKDQSCNDYQLVVVDGNSRDESKKIINNSDIISKKIIEDDEGIYDALNKGIGQAEGDYILALNSGDVFVDIQVLYKTKKNIIDDNKNHDIYFGNATIKIENKITNWKVPQKNLINTDKWIENHNPCHQTAFIHKKIYKEYNYNKYFQILGDSDFWHKVKNKYTFKYLDLDIVYYDLEGISSLPSSLKQTLQYAYEEFLIKGLYKKQTPYKIWLNSIPILLKHLIKLLARKILGRNFYFLLLKKYNQNK